MKNKLLKLSIIILFILIFINNNIIYKTIYTTTLIWFKNIVPNIFPMFIITSLIIESNLINNITNIFGNIFSKIFKTSSYSIFVFILSIFTGSPSNAKYIKDLYKNNLITKEECNKLLLFTTNFNSLLIYNLLNTYLSKYNSIKIIIVLILTNIIIGLLNRNLIINKINTKNIQNNIKLSQIIKDTIDTLLMILGTLICFNILINILPINNTLLKNIINGFLEVTTAINTLETLNITINLKQILTLTYLSFGGLSIHLQIKSILPDTNYKLFLKNKLLSIIISIILFYTLG